MIIRSRAPLRIGLAGGGTDVSPYSDEYGGAILNTTISLYAYAVIEPLSENKIILEAKDRNEFAEYDLADHLPIENPEFKLHKGVYNRLVVDKRIKIPAGFRLTTYVDAPAGSGLGTSSTLVVAILNAFAEWQGIPFGEYDLAHYAYEIERLDLKLAGGKQDQYAATFGGFNFMEFSGRDKVIVNPLRIKNEILHELENNLLLFFTSTNRESAKIITEQVQNVRDKNEFSIEAMHNLKEQAIMMKEALLKGKTDALGEILDYGFTEKKKMASSISNSLIEELYETAKKNGASGGKISGAGGGGFMIFYCPKNTKYTVLNALKKHGGIFHPYTFTKEGAISWKRL
jgi:D-glycero-alpha-D-manno-heptose-7-phosphate kinase